MWIQKEFDAMNLKKQKGFTLVELLVAMSIFAIVMTPISFMLYWGYHNYFTENESMNATQKANDAVNMIIDDLRRNENKFMNIDNITYHKLTIKDDINFPGEELIYSYSPGNMKIFRNGVSIFDDSLDIKVINFEVNEIVGDEIDSKIIKVMVELTYGKSQPVKIESSYGRKLN